MNTEFETYHKYIYNSAVTEQFHYYHSSVTIQRCNETFLYLYEYVPSTLYGQGLYRQYQ